jgi:hypothetical protein
LDRQRVLALVSTERSSLPLEHAYVSQPTFFMTSLATLSIRIATVIATKWNINAAALANSVMLLVNAQPNQNFVHNARMDKAQSLHRDCVSALYTMSQLQFAMPHAWQQRTSCSSAEVTTRSSTPQQVFTTLLINLMPQQLLTHLYMVELLLTKPAANARL